MPGLLRGVMRTAAIAGTATAVSNRVSERQGERWAAQGKFGQAEPQPAPQAAEDDTIGKLRELGELRDKGVLTDEEFAQQKARLLG